MFQSVSLLCCLILFLCVVIRRAVPLACFHCVSILFVACLLFFFFSSSDLKSETRPNQPGFEGLTQCWGIITLLPAGTSFSKERCTDPVKLTYTSLRHFSQESPRPPPPRCPSSDSIFPDWSWHWDDSLRSDKNCLVFLGISLGWIVARLPPNDLNEFHLNVGFGIGLHCFSWGGFWSRWQSQMFSSFLSLVQ